ncbi:hypothetical protein [Chishuiella changwenlii]|uniref:hypothetical protein n=1 Tax=Chishuiella changwenlii TaxID=1434701 RepID=UPI002FD9F0BC
MDEKLYELILEKLKQINEIRLLDFDYGQLMEEKPPISYPAVLIDIDYPLTQNISTTMQEVRILVKLTIVTKSLSETNHLAPKPVRSKGLEFLRLRQKVYTKLQGFGNEEFFPFERKSMRTAQIRQGLKTTVLQFETSCHDDTASS